jgi:hypothetical protein
MRLNLLVRHQDIYLIPGPHSRDPALLSSKPLTGSFLASLLATGMFKLQSRRSRCRHVKVAARLDG